MAYPKTDAVAWYAVSRDRVTHRIMRADGPHDAATAHRAVDSAIRPALTLPGETFDEVGVIRAQGGPFPEMHARDRRPIPPSRPAVAR
jgi:hypothetical protein